MATRQSSDAQGLVSVLIAREHRQANVSVCGYLVDVFCLGLKDALGPRAMTAAEYPEFASRYFQSFADAPIRVPIELAQALVIGAVEYARALGFEPHRDFERARPHLGDWNSPSPIVFGDRGRPHYISGPHDDPMRVIATLRRTVGDGKFITTILG